MIPLDTSLAPPTYDPEILATVDRIDPDDCNEYQAFELVLDALITAGCHHDVWVAWNGRRRETEDEYPTDELLRYWSDVVEGIEPRSHSAAKLSRIPRNYEPDQGTTLFRVADMPRPVWFADEFRAGLPDLAPELIGGLLRQGHKMLVSGGSKASKSFALIELAIAIAEGRRWLGWPCTQGRVLYVNLELDRASCLHRFKKVGAALGVDAFSPEQLAIWNLRGHACGDRGFHDAIIGHVKATNAAAVIIDPIYKVITGDENSARDVSEFTARLDNLIAATGAAVIYCHHHSKGSQGQKRSMDRASGSGVFARDCDALLDFVELPAPEGIALRIEGTLREFKGFAPLDVWFRFPIHELDTDGKLKAIRPRGERVPRDKATPQKKTGDDYKAETLAAFEAVVDEDGVATVNDVAEQLNVEPRQARTRIDRAGLIRRHGKVTQ